MNSRLLFLRLPRPGRPVSAAARALWAAAGAVFALLLVRPASAAEAPGWMHALVNVPLPAHDEKTDAVLLYSEENVTVRSADKIKTVVRRAYKILRPGGRSYASVRVDFDTQTHISNLHGWCIPPQGKDYEVKEKDAVEVALYAITGSDLISDVRQKFMLIPAADPGSIIGYEYEQEDRPYFLQDIWYFQSEIPVREATYSLQLPAGWEFKATWLNAPEIAPVSQPGNQWSWTIKDVKALPAEDSMPPWRGILGQMIVNVIAPPGTDGAAKLSDWNSIGNWYNGLLRGRSDPSPAIQQKVAELTASLSAPLDKMRALAAFVQRNIRYVAIELGIGGFQPHLAADVFTNRYGDCKDKVNLMRSMLGQIGVTSYLVAINTERGSVTPAMPGRMGAFDHAIIAIRLPDGLNDSSLAAVWTDPKLGRLLLFDPTDDLTPFGHLSGALQASYALLVTPGGGQLIETPQLAPSSSGIERSAHLTLNSQGTLSGQVRDVRLGDFAASQRGYFRNTEHAADRIKPIESLLSHSFSTFRINNADVVHLDAINFPVQFDYSFTADDYAKRAGNLLLVRPRVLGTKSSGLLETRDPRRQAVVFDGPERDVDTFEITLPPGYVVDDIPPAVDIDLGFASYHSKSEAKGNTLIYTRTFEIKDLFVPLSKVNELRNLYRVISSDERNDAVIRPGP